jgi:hypothetical protein
MPRARPPSLAQHEHPRPRDHRRAMRGKCARARGTAPGGIKLPRSALDYPNSHMLDRPSQHGLRMRDPHNREVQIRGLSSPLGVSVPSSLLSLALVSVMPARVESLDAVVAS